MPIQRPTHEQLRQLASDLYLHLSDEDLQSFRELMEPSFRSLDTLEGMSEELPPVRYPRGPGYQPEGEENALGAWYVKSAR